MKDKITDYYQKTVKDLLADRCKENNEPSLEEKHKVWFQEMEPFDGNVYKIPSLPILEKEEYDTIIVPNLIRCGAIPKKDLKIGETYIGKCRNAREAVWDGEKFTYQRYKFGFTYPETINHFEDDNGYDLFVPIKKKENENR